jgi:hypothetical protein
MSVAVHNAEIKYLNISTVTGIIIVEHTLTTIVAMGFSEGPQHPYPVVSVRSARFVRQVNTVIVRTVPKTIMRSSVRFAPPVKYMMAVLVFLTVTAQRTTTSMLPLGKTGYRTTIEAAVSIVMI